MKPFSWELFEGRERAISAAQLSEVFKASGIRRPVEDLPRLKLMVENANLLVGAWKGQKLIGVARGMTDFSYACYLSDLAVDRAHQRIGVGKALLEYVREKLGERVMILLVSAPEAADYYAKLGFEPVDGAWKLPRRL